MANPIIQQINTELTELQNELTKFKNTVDYLNGAKAAVQDAVEKVNHSEGHFNKKIEELKSTYDSIIGLSQSVSSVMTKLDTINFPERLDKIEKTVQLTIATFDETKKQTIEQVQKASETIIKVDFDKKFIELQNIIKTSSKASDQLVSIIEKQQLDKKIIDVTNQISRIQKNSNSELTEKMNQSSKDQIQVIYDLITELNLIEIKISESIKESNINLSNKLKNSENELINLINMTKKSIDSQSIRNKYYNYITWTIILLVFLLLYFVK